LAATEPLVSFLVCDIGLWRLSRDEPPLQADALQQISQGLMAPSPTAGPFAKKNPERVLCA